MHWNITNRKKYQLRKKVIMNSRFKRWKEIEGGMKINIHAMHEYSQHNLILSISTARLYLGKQFEYKKTLKTFSNMHLITP